MLVITGVSFGAVAESKNATIDIDVNASYQQTISGVVTDENNLPIPGVNVIVKNCKRFFYRF